MLENIENTMAHLAMDKLGQNLAGRIPSRSRHVRHNAVANSALNILQLWASEGRTREPIWIKFGSQQQQQQVRTAMTVTRLPMHRLGRNLGGRIPSCSKYWKYCNSSYDGTDWDDSWLVASKQHLCCKTVSLVFGRYC